MSHKYLFESEIGPGRSSNIKSSQRIGSPYRLSKEAISPERKSREVIGSPYRLSKEAISPKSLSSRLSKEPVSSRRLSRVVGPSTDSDSEDKEHERINRKRASFLEDSEKGRQKRAKYLLLYRNGDEDAFSFYVNKIPYIVYGALQLAQKEERERIQQEEKDKKERRRRKKEERMIKEQREMFLEDRQERLQLLLLYRNANGDYNPTYGEWSDYQDILKLAEEEYEESMKEREKKLEKERLEGLDEYIQTVKASFLENSEKGRQKRAQHLESYRNGDKYAFQFEMDGVWYTVKGALEMAEREEEEKKVAEELREEEKKVAEELRVILEEDSKRGRQERMRNLLAARNNEEYAFKYKLHGQWHFYPASIRKRAEEEEIEKDRLDRKERLRAYNAGNRDAFDVYNWRRRGYYMNTGNMEKAIQEDKEDKERQELERLRKERENRFASKQVKQEREQSKLVDEARRRRQQKESEKKWWKKL